MTQTHTKIKFAAACFFFFLYLAAGVFLLQKEERQKNQAGTREAANPRVLGEITSIRGDVTGPATPEDTLKRIREPDFKNISAKSFLAYDEQTGQTLAEKQPDLRLPVASLTKLITALTVYDNLDLSSRFTIGKKDEFSVAPVLRLAEGDEVKVNDLFDSMLIGSANDAALALADHTESATGRNFTDLMNQKAKNLNMSNSNFSNPLGFDSTGNYSTADDLKQAVNVLQQLSAFTSLGRRTGYSFSSSAGKIFKIQSTNKLLETHPEMEAVKTGFTENSKGSIIAKVNWSGRKIIIIVLGSQDREKDLVNLEREIMESYRNGGSLN